MNAGCRSCACSKLLLKNSSFSRKYLSRTATCRLRRLAPRLTDSRPRVASRWHHSTTSTPLSWFSSLVSRYAPAPPKSSSITSEEDPAKYNRGGYHPVHLGEVLDQRYRIISKLGYGIYSTVWLAEDLAHASKTAESTQNRRNLRPPRYVALKILTADSYGTSQSIFEREILRHIRRVDVDHPGYKHVVHLLDNFVHAGPNGDHVCLVTELLGPSVMNLQQISSKKQLPKRIGQQIARQTLRALDWLHESCGIIHTDIKPSNILIEIPSVQETVQVALDEEERNSSRVRDSSGLRSRPITKDSPHEPSEIVIKLIDLGVASWKDKHLSDWIQPPSLRAPEVFLGSPWDSRVEMWNFACVIYELVQGRVLFRGRHGPDGTWTAEEDQLAQMVELFGPIPASVRDSGELSHKYFDKKGNFLNIKHLHPYSLSELLKQTSNVTMSSHDYAQFERFLEAMLHYDPAARKTPKELLEEPWLSNSEQG